MSDMGNMEIKRLEKMTDIENNSVEKKAQEVLNLLSLAEVVEILLEGAGKLKSDFEEVFIPPKQRQLPTSDSYLFLKISVDIKENPSKYNKAGKWLDETDHYDNWSELKKLKLKKLIDFRKKGILENSQTRQEQAAEIFFDWIQLVLFPKNEDHRKIKMGKAVSFFGDLFKKKTLIARITDRLYCLLSIKRMKLFFLYQKFKLSLRPKKLNSYATILEHFFINNKVLSNASYQHPQLLYAFDYLTESCNAMQIIDIENAHRICLLTWIFTDLDKYKYNFGITKYEKLSDSNHFNPNTKVYEKHLRLVKLAWTKVHAEKDIKPLGDSKLDDPIDQKLVELFQKANEDGILPPGSRKIARALYEAGITPKKYSHTAINKRIQKLRDIGLVGHPDDNKDKAKRCTPEHIDDMGSQIKQKF